LSSPIHTPYRLAVNRAQACVKNLRAAVPHGLIAGCLLGSLGACASDGTGDQADNQAGTGVAMNPATSAGAPSPAGTSGMVTGAAGSGAAANTPLNSQAGVSAAGMSAGAQAGVSGTLAPAGMSAGSDAAQAGMSGGSDAGTAGSAPIDSTGQCRPKFGSGLNVAWFKFAGDVPNPDLARFQQLYRDTHDAGGRIVRWWFHTNGTVTPGYDSSGLAKKISTEQIADVRSILDAAHTAGVAVVISLWSFDMLQGNQSAPLANNQALLSQDSNRQAYIDQVLTPLVAALHGHPGLYAWEVFNEPEGMTTEHGWTMQNGGQTVAEAVIQKCVNWFADAIHKADPAALVTNGAWQFAVTATVSGYQNAYSDSALQAAGGRAQGTLDFYEVHYYDNWNGSEVVSPFTHPQSYWNVDKKIAIGEFWATTTNGVAAADLFTQLYDGGYSGAWAWQYANDDGSNAGMSTKWPSMQVPMQKLYTAHPAELECD
jgi:Cellulase (glycosyl hydrolase family 5)